MIRNKQGQFCVSAAIIILLFCLLFSINVTDFRNGDLSSGKGSDTPRPLPHFQSSKWENIKNSIGYHQPEDKTENFNKKPKIWVSMGLCFGETTEKYGKKYYPYSEVTPLALMIWNYFFPDPEEVSVLLFLVYKTSEKTPHMEAYEKTIVQTGAFVEWIPADGIDCIMKSQIVRMFAFGHPLVKPDDVVMTVDVNFFLLTPKIFSPIYENPKLFAWMYQYEETAGIETGNGETFNQNLISMPAKIWRSILEAPSKLNKEWLDGQINKISLNGSDTWYFDQWITTFALLKHRICSAPEKSGLWNHKDLTYDPDFDDSSTCWHGKYFRDCNKEMRIVAEGCKWYHFFPSETFEAHVTKFNEITNNFYMLNMSSVIDYVRRKK